MARFREIDSLPARLYAIGDIHGCPNELRVLIDFLSEVEQLTSDDLVIFMGDYIDRGPDSRAVIESLIEFKRFHGNVVFLRGNHEDMLLDWLGYEGRSGASYLMNGGASFVASYGLSAFSRPDEIQETIPPEHLAFLLNLESGIIVDSYLFVHAGINPLRGIDLQIDDDLYWIRDEFICNVHKSGKTIVFGHTPYQDVMFHLPYKVGVDTGLVYGNMLSCIELMEGRILQVERNGQEVKKDTFANRGLLQE